MIIQENWRAVHLRCGNRKSFDSVTGQLPQLARLGVNTIIMEVNYGFEYSTHPELIAADNPITADDAGRLVELCHNESIRLIPHFQCLGHQSWAENTGPLLTVYPELDIAPGAFPENAGIYCREWDPLNPRVLEIVLPMMAELISAFQADALHVGLDEVFLLGCEQSPSTSGQNPAFLFSKVINDLHTFLVGEKKVEMLMWGDRLLNGEDFSYDEWESDFTGTAAAVEMIPKDIIICDWHYELRKRYESVEMFCEKGFRVLPAGWEKVEATLNLIRYSQELNQPLVLGHLFTNWSTKPEQLSRFEPLLQGLPLLLS